MGLEYVDIFYHHRPDFETPLEETMGALDQIVRSGKALYVGISQYDPERTAQAAQILKALGTPCLIHQPNYSLFDRWVEGGLLQTLEEEGIGAIVFSPLAQGLLTSKYLAADSQGIPPGSRAARSDSYLSPADVSAEKIARAQRLNELARRRGQSLAQMALAWVLRQPAVTSALIGASRPEQIDECAGALDSLAFAPEELAAIEAILFDLANKAN
jgi:L-glyceraldehyde 3-phosphate reductase